jgi:hypothetical protein
MREIAGFILVVSIIANLLFIAALYFLPYRLVNAVLAVFAPNKPAWSPRRWVRAAIVGAIVILVPLFLNSLHHYQRVALLNGDKPGEGSISEIGTLALLTDSFEDKGWPSPRGAGQVVAGRCSTSILRGLCSSGRRRQ